MSKKNLVLGMYALAAMTYGKLGNDVKYMHSEPEETDEERKHRIAKAEIERNKANGLKEFFYGENSVWAINQKNADKKARSKHWL